jgi:Ni/Fe-hydrogenase subunit HybB-like protein
MSQRAQPVGGPIFTRPVRFFAALFALGAILILWRLVVGLGATTALSDGQPWGLWIAFDVVVGTALACGGYAMGLLVFILNRGRYHPLIRPAILTSALGYTIAGFSVFLDLGKGWTIWRVPTYFWSWNLHSALLEVALCIMTYMFVLWIELSPAFLEKIAASGRDSGAKRFAKKALPVLDRILIWVMGLGLLLPTMHQSSLGSLLVLSGPKLHPLWWSPFLPLLFLISCIAMGYAAVVFESTLSTRFFGRKTETDMLAGLSGAMLPVLGAFFVLRLADLAYRGKLGYAFAFDRFALAFWIEGTLVALPFVLLAPSARRRDPGNLFRAAMLMMLAGTVYRFNTYLLAYRPFDDVHYFPSVAELMITVGLVSLEIIAYSVIVKIFPIISGAPQRAAAHT